METVCSSDKEAVTLLSFGPRTSRPAPNPGRNNNKKSEKFSFKFRRRSKSAPRHQQQNQQTDRELNGRITYSANGETKVKNPDSPFKRDGVQLVGFTSYRGCGEAGGDQVSDSGHNCLSLDSAETLASADLSVHNNLDKQYRAVSDSRTLSRTSKDIKMERERLRQERLGLRSWQPPGGHQSSKMSLLHNSRLMAEERAKFFDEAREMFHGHSDPATAAQMFSQMLAEREGRMLGGTRAPTAFSGTVAPTLGSSGAGANTGVSDQLMISPGVTVTGQTGQSGHQVMSEPETGSRQPPVARTSDKERIIPIRITRESDNCNKTLPSSNVRIIPVMVETSDSSTDTLDNSDNSDDTAASSSATESNDSTPCEDDSLKMPNFPSLLSEMKLGDRTSFHHPSFANHFGFARLRPDDKSIFSSTGIRDSFPGFPNFGNFPSFTPLLTTAGPERPFPDRQTRFRDKSKADSIHKQRIGKSKSSVEYSSDKPNESFRYVSDNDAAGDTMEPYGDSESESEDDDLDSVSVIADRTRDRLSGTGSTHSHDGSTHSHDSGISEETETAPVVARIRVRGSGSGARRPDSAVPSEYSLVSDTSSCEGAEDKIFRLSEARPLLVNHPPPASVTPSTSEAEASEDYQARLHKAYVIASELVKTEIHYVAILHLIDQVFHFRVDQENRSQHMFAQEMITTIFSNIKSIYKFHAEFLLPQLEERMSKWQEGPEYQRIGDIMVKNAPFLKMYTEYVKNFDTAMNTINTLYAKNSKFSAIVDDIHSMSECENLTLQHHMLTPIQRIPRYEMLLKDYCQKLPENSPDRQDSESALLQVSQAAAHANDSMKRIEQFKKLLEVQESIGGSIDLVSPTREVLKEGKIVKISARTGDHQDRYLFLLSDLLLLCSPRKSMISGPQFSLRAKFEVDNLQVLEGDNLVTANTFYVRDEQKSVELYTTTKQDKEEWLEFLFLAIKSLYTRKSSLRVGRDILRPLDSEIGKKQPHMQKVENVQKCTECSAQFSILKHKHNCRFCGAVFCSKCSDCRYPLPWEDGRKARICRSCHHVLTSQTNTQTITELPVRPKGLLEVPANTPAVHSGWLVLRPPGSKSSSTKRFFILLSDFVLYSFRSEKDASALTATPVPGFTVLTGSGLKGDSGCSEKDREKVIKMFHPSSKRTYYFAGTAPTEVERWAEMLLMASKAEVPKSFAESDSLLSTDNHSTSSTEYENG